MNRGDIVEAVIVFIIFIFISMVISGISGSTKGSRKRQEAVEEQRRRRAAYEAEHGKMTATSQQHIPAEDYRHNEHPYYPPQARQPQPMAQQSVTSPAVVGNSRSSALVGAIPECYQKTAVASSPELTKSSAPAVPMQLPANTATLQPAARRMVWNVDEIRRGIVMAEILGPCRAQSGPLRLRR